MVERVKEQPSANGERDYRELLQPGVLHDLEQPIIILDQGDEH